MKINIFLFILIFAFQIDLYSFEKDKIFEDNQFTKDFFLKIKNYEIKKDEYNWNDIFSDSLKRNLLDDRIMPDYLLEYIINDFKPYFDNDYVRLAKAINLFRKDKYDEAFIIFKLLEKSKYKKIVTYFLIQINIINKNLAPLDNLKLKNFKDDNDYVFDDILLNSVYKIFRNKTVANNELEYIKKSDCEIKNLLLGDIYFIKKKYKKAIVYYKKQKKNEENNYLNYAIGLSFYNLYKYNNAAYYWRKNISSENCSYDKQALFDLAELYYQTKNYLTAIPYYEEFIKKYGIPTQKKWFYRFLNCYYKIEKYEELHYLLIKYNEDQEIKEDFSQKLAYYFYEKKDFLTAKSYFKKIKNKTEDDNFYNSLCNYYLDESLNYKDFITNFIVKNPLNKHSEKLLYDLGLFYLQKNEKEVYENLIKKSGVNSKRIDFIMALLVFKNSPILENYYNVWIVFDELKNKDKYFLLISQLNNDFVLSEPEKLINLLSEETKDYHFFKMADQYENKNNFLEANKLLMLIKYLPYNPEISLKISKNYILKKEFENAKNILDTLSVNNDFEINSNFSHTKSLLYIAENNYIKAALVSAKFLNDYKYNFCNFKDLIISLHLLNMDFYKKVIFHSYKNKLTINELHNIKFIKSYEEEKENMFFCPLNELIRDLELLNEK